MHNICIPIFQLIFYKFSYAPFKIYTTSCYLAFKFVLFVQKVSKKCTLRRLTLIIGIFVYIK